MKTCPICHSSTFDDADVCYGCMHRFDEEPEPVLPMVPRHSAGRHALVESCSALPAFLITLTPPADPGQTRSWTCSVKLVQA